MNDASRASLKDWLSLARLSNVPTVWSNVLVGLVVAYTVRRIYSGHELPGEWDRLRALFIDEGGWLIVLAASAFYAMGMVLNDVADRRIDAVERPGRPLPSGRITVRAASTAAIVLMVVGLLLLAFLQNVWTLVWAAALLAAIVGYDMLHKRSSGAVVLMGACRGLVYFLAASTSAAAHEADWWRGVTPFAVVVMVYTILITVIARSENKGVLDGRKWLALAMPLLVLPVILNIMPLGSNLIWASIAAMVLVLWLGRAAAFVLTNPPATKDAVLTWISGMCLVDAYFLTLMGWPVAALFAGGCFVATVIAHQRIAGT